MGYSENMNFTDFKEEILISVNIFESILKIIFFFKNY